MSVSLDVFSEENSQIESPHGLFLVSDKTVSYVHNVDQKIDNGSYKIEMYIIKSVYSEHAKNEMLASGWWAPNTQQFYSSNLSKATGGVQCEWWEDARWGFSYKAVKLNISGKTVNAYKQSKDYVENRMPKRMCENYRFYTDNCERVRCNKWVAPTANRFLIKSKGDALNYFHEIKGN